MTQNNAADVAVIGSGSWGTAMAGLLAKKCRVKMWCLEDEIVRSINTEHRNCVYLSDYILSKNVIASSDFAKVLSDISLCVFAVPSSFLRSVARRAAPYLDPEVSVVVLTKGIEQTTHALMNQVLQDELGHSERICALSGPNHAEEVCKGKISAAVLAGNPLCTSKILDFFFDPRFRVYLSEDITGVEVCAALKNVIAIACGAAYAIDAGDNALAAIMTRGLAEIGRLSVALGGEPITPMGLAGMGDLIVTCTSRHSRNRSFGYALVEGYTLEQYEQKTRMVVEGAHTAQSAYELALKHGVSVPITEVVCNALDGTCPITKAVDILINRKATGEFYGIV